MQLISNFFFFFSLKLTGVGERKCPEAQVGRGVGDGSKGVLDRVDGLVHDDFTHLEFFLVSAGCVRHRGPFFDRVYGLLMKFDQNNERKRCEDRYISSTRGAPFS